MSADGFAVGLGRHLLTGFVHRTPWLWKWLAKLESASLRDRLASTEIRRPVWISGLARSGSTILLEALASHGDVATHQYRDFPFVAIPHFWRTTVDRAGGAVQEPTERAHADRLLVSGRSPEAFEEVLWMMFFDRLHDPARSAVLGADARNGAFESFFADHIRKLLLAAGRSRYVAKANYDITRLGYIQRQFPDARFIVPIRDARAHIGSLRKQHALFCEAAAAHPRSVSHLDRAGHFEFGLHRRAINAGNTDEVRSIEELWQRGEDVRGWARYWAHVYGALGAQLDADPKLAAATMVVRYEDLCERSEATLRRILAHAGLESPELVERFAARLTAPTYYEPEIGAKDDDVIEAETGAVRALFGYGAEQQSGTQSAGTDPIQAG